MARLPVDEATYDLLIVLSSKLEALHLYERLAAADVRHSDLVRQLLEAESRHAEILLGALRERLLASPGPERPAGQGGPDDPAAPHGRAGIRDPQDVDLERAEVQRTGGTTPPA